jgi:flagellar assembly factor FliW
MQLTGTRFGDIDFDGEKAIFLRSGLIGFPAETRFVLLSPKGKKPIAWLQSLHTPALAFPVVESTRIVPRYPAETEETLAQKAGLDGARVSVFVIVSVRPKSRVVANLLAPIVVDRASGNGVQIVLDARKYSASKLLGSMHGQEGRCE